MVNDLHDFDAQLAVRLVPAQHCQATALHAFGLLPKSSAPTEIAAGCARHSVKCHLQQLLAYHCFVCRICGLTATTGSADGVLSSLNTCYIADVLQQCSQLAAWARIIKMLDLHTASKQVILANAHVVFT